MNKSLVNKSLLMMLVMAVSCSASARKLTKTEISDVEKIVKSELTNPVGAKFSHGNFYNLEDGNLYCGYVDEKNSSGSYSGKRIFSVFMGSRGNDRYRAMSADTNDVTGELYTQNIIEASCAKAGYDIPVNRELLDLVNKDRKKNGFPLLDKSMIKR